MVLTVWFCDVAAGGGEQNTIYKGVETFPHFKALRGSSKGKAQRGQYLLPMILEPDTGRCASLFAFTRRGRHDAMC